MEARKRQRKGLTYHHHPHSSETEHGSACSEEEEQEPHELQEDQKAGSAGSSSATTTANTGSDASNSSNATTNSGSSGLRKSGWQRLKELRARIVETERASEAAATSGPSPATGDLAADDTSPAIGDDGSTSEPPRRRQRMTLINCDDTSEIHHFLDSEGVSAYLHIASPDAVSGPTIRQKPRSAGTWHAQYNVAVKWYPGMKNGSDGVVQHGTFTKWVNSDEIFKDSDDATDP